MGVLRKAAIIGTGGMARAVIKPNSKKARIAKAAEKELKLEKAAARRQEMFNRRQLELAAVAARAASVPGDSVADELAKLVALRESGVLTADEFSAQKAKLLA